MSSDNQLTNRESEILQLIADGKQTKKSLISCKLSRKNSQTHRLRSWKKLDVHSGIESINSSLVWVFALYKKKRL
ncbi:LuxR C-terminal-related transcriptional regulator [Escherichia coli]|uniref:LuxR C-terminal-related transcriptional regulator n=1 Tax=Escherichia coli TaxID=562 RepID=UPI003D662E34